MSDLALRAGGDNDLPLTMTLYEELRAAGKELNKKVLEIPLLAGIDPVHVAKKLTLRLAGRTLMFAGDADRAAYFDFWLHEYKVDGKSLLDHLSPEASALTPLQADLLKAQCRGETSLFQTEAWPLDQERSLLRDLLDPAREPIVLTDPGLSQSLNEYRTPLVLFCRPLPVGGVVITSGFSLVFHIARGAGLVQAYHQKTKRTPPQDLPEQRFVFFFQKFSQIARQSRTA